MGLPFGRLASIVAVTLAIALAAATAFLALAHDGPEICATPAADVGGETSFLAENDAAMKKK
jgi:hypothetical protein